MTKVVYRFFDNNTGEEIYASDGFTMIGVPEPEHRIHDAELMARFGGPAVVNRFEESTTADGAPEFRVYVDGVEERLNAGNDVEQSYRPS